MAITASSPEALQLLGQIILQSIRLSAGFRLTVGFRSVVKRL